jgi:hypothetical protein
MYFLQNDQDLVIKNCQRFLGMNILAPVYCLPPTNPPDTHKKRPPVWMVLLCSNKKLCNLKQAVGSTEGSTALLFRISNSER